MDHLGHRQFHTLGGCIGSSFCLKLCEIAPDRISAAVLQNPIRLHPEFPTYFPDSFKDWAKDLQAGRSDLDAPAAESFGHNMWSGDFVYSVSRDFCAIPCLVLPGNDTPHPAVVGAELANILPKAELLQDWKGPQHLVAQRRCVVEFLAKHTP